MMGPGGSMMTGTLQGGGCPAEPLGRFGVELGLALGFGIGFEEGLVAPGPAVLVLEALGGEGGKGGGGTGGGLSGAGASQVFLWLSCLL